LPLILLCVKNRMTQFNILLPASQLRVAYLQCNNIQILPLHLVPGCCIIIEKFIGAGE
jgi:hypothetical protein